MSRPQLYVFAGPNGSGKSTLSASLVPTGVIVFDGDVIFQQLKQKFYGLDESLLWENVNERVFAQWKLDALSAGVDAAFETNFRSSEVIETVRAFKEAGFEVRLVFMGLDSVEASIDRVALRAAKGGHNVTLEFITKNYRQSLANLYEYYRVFTSVHIFQNYEAEGGGYEMVSLMGILENEVLEVAEELPEWAEKLRTVVLSGS